jgi:hypothetical protein
MYIILGTDHYVDCTWHLINKWRIWASIAGGARHETVLAWMNANAILGSQPIAYCHPKFEEFRGKGFRQASSYRVSVSMADQRGAAVPERRRAGQVALNAAVHGVDAALAGPYLPDSPRHVYDSG